MILSQNAHYGILSFSWDFNERLLFHQIHKKVAWAYKKWESSPKEIETAMKDTVLFSPLAFYFKRLHFNLLQWILHGFDYKQPHILRTLGGKEEILKQIELRVSTGKGEQKSTVLPIDKHMHYSLSLFILVLAFFPFCILEFASISLRTGEQLGGLEMY